MEDHTEKLRIIASVKEKLSLIGIAASPDDESIIAAIMGELTELEYSLMP